MDIFLGSVLVVNGGMLAWIVIDSATRIGLKAQLEKQRHDYEDATYKLNELHNQSAKKLLELEDKVAAHQYQLTSKVAPHAPKNPFINKR